MEALNPSWQIKSQLFRIYSVQKTESEVKVEAQHISYDAVWNLTMYNSDEADTISNILDGIVEESVTESSLYTQTNIGMKLTANYKGKDPITCILDPDIGILARTGGKLLRDDYNIAILSECGIDRGVTFEYGKNLEGVDYKIDTTETISAVIPEGETDKGERYFLSDNYIAPDDFVFIAQPSTGESDGLEKYKVSSAFDDYLKQKGLVLSPKYGRNPLDRKGRLPFERVYLLEGDDCTISPKDTDKKEKITEGMVKNRLMEQAFKYLSENDVPKLTLEIDMAQLGESAQFSQFADMERVFLWDTVSVFYKPLNLIIKAQVVEIKWDCIADRLTGIVLDNVINYATPINSWQITGIEGKKIAKESINGSSLKPFSISEIKLTEDFKHRIDSIDEMSISAWKFANNSYDIASRAGYQASQAVGEIEKLNKNIYQDEDGCLVIKDDNGVSTVTVSNAAVHIGTDAGNPLIDGYSTLAARYVQFGNYQLRQTNDGGLAFKLEKF